MTYGVKVAGRGYGVDDSYKHMALHTKYANPKVNLKADPPHFGSFKHVINGSLSVGTHLIKAVKHNYGYIPMVVAHYIHPESANFELSTGVLPFPVVQASTVLYEWKAVATADKVEFRLEVNSGDTSGEEVTVRYYIFAEAGM